METLIIHPRTPKELATIEAIMNALDVPFHKQQEGFDPSFAAKIEAGRLSNASQSGNTSGDDIWKLE